MIWLTLAFFIYIAQFVTIMVSEVKNPQKGFAWLYIVLVFPLIGLVLYYLLAQNYRRRLAAKHKGAASSEGRDLLPSGETKSIQGTATLPLQHHTRLLQVVENLPNSMIGLNNKVDVLASAEEMYAAMLNDIMLAEHHIHMLYYIWNDDETGKWFQDALLKKAREAVKVRIIYDGIGCYPTPQQYWQRFRDAGVEVHSFLPPRSALFKKRLNYRNHRKITVTDGKAGYVGGINIGDEYVGKNGRLGYWRDASVRMEGDAVYELQRTFLQDWQFVSGEQLMRHADLFPTHQHHSAEAIQIVSSGPNGARNTIQELFFSAFATSAERIYVTTPYFIPDQSVLTALKTAALAGVDVRIVIPGVADTQLTLWASLSFVQELLEAGVRVYRYEKGFMHAKQIVVDGHFASIGSANMDLRSFYSNFELNACFFGKDVVEKIAKDVVRDMEDSREIQLTSYFGRGKEQKLKETIGRLLSPLL